MATAAGHALLHAVDRLNARRVERVVYKEKCVRYIPRNVLWKLGAECTEPRSAGHVLTTRVRRRENSDSEAAHITDVTYLPALGKVLPRHLCPDAGRLHGEESALDRLRAETAAAAAGEAALIANLRGQVGELQGVLQVGDGRRCRRVGLHVCPSPMPQGIIAAGPGRRAAGRAAGGSGVWGWVG